MLTLYEIAAEYRRDAEMLADLDLPEQTVIDTLESIGGALQDKAKNIGAFIKHLEMLSDGMRDAEHQIAARRKALENRVQRIKSYTLNVMQNNDIQRIDTPMFAISVAKNPPQVDVFDEKQVPKEFMRQPEPPPPSVDKRLVMDAIKSGVEVPGCRLKQDVRLQIK